VANADGGQLIYGMTENKNNHLPGAARSRRC
jgi:hypothetical protein